MGLDASQPCLLGRRRAAAVLAAALVVLGVLGAATTRPAEAFSSTWWSYNVTSGYPQVTQKWGCTNLQIEVSNDPRISTCPAGQAYWHEGLDIGLPTGTPINAGLAGTVISYGDNSQDACAYGSDFVRYRLASNVYDVILAHVEGPHENSPGASVPVGGLLALSDNESPCGGTTGAHLHFEVRKAGSNSWLDSVDPVPFAGPQTVGLFRGSAGAAFLMRTQNTTGSADLPTINYGNPTDLPVVGDWQGNGVRTVAVFRPSSGTFYFRYNNTSVSFGQSGDIPLAGDWTGKGYESMGVYRPSVGWFYLQDDNTTPGATRVDHAINYGNPGDTGIVGHWRIQYSSKGYPIDGYGVWRPSTDAGRGVGVWNLHQPDGQADFSFEYQLNTDFPVVGDWTDQGITTVGVFRNGTWLLRNSNSAGGYDLAVGYGDATDQNFITGHWATDSES